MNSGEVKASSPAEPAEPQQADKPKACAVCWAFSWYDPWSQDLKRPPRPEKGRPKPKEKHEAGDGEVCEAKARSRIRHVGTLAFFGHFFASRFLIAEEAPGHIKKNV